MPKEAVLTRPIKLSDVAKAAGVSQGTASNVFNRPQIVRPEVRERVEAAARALGYAGPDPKGRLLRAGKVNAIGIVTSDPLTYFFDDPYARVLMSGIAAACAEQGAGLSLVSAVNEEKLAWNIQSAIVDGFILLCIEDGFRLVELTRERKLPFVALQYENRDPSISAIGVDDFDGARRIAEHLGALGHRRVAIISLQLAEIQVGPVALADVEKAVYSGTRDRILGYLRGMESFGVDPHTVPIVETRNDSETVSAALDHVFSLSEPPTAILAMSDRAALIALDWLRAKGLKVPEDVSVVGFDGVPEAERSDPPLTTIAQPIERMGREAVAMILEHDDAPRQVMLDTELVIRGSTAPPRG
ncbi:LacI family DNA-binding transcriptional regulator [Kaistia hirudinis]|uniref:LacI family DNA-binding transcriptional regulator n=1 Tax=Kaistia hirudinis TaxID=1293440 RepID=UPI0016145678|nr:LacI family DNA-binding transcriptional regulator [Kaistia hirudinis]